MSERTYVAVDLKSFYASSECVEHGFPPLSTHLVVADQSRTDKTICLAVSPSLKEYGLPGRARLFEVKAKLKEVNAARRAVAPGGVLTGKSYDAKALADNPNLAADVFIAKPRMSHYLAMSAKIYGIYLKYVSADDIHVYSVDEVFMDVTGYLRAYGKGVEEMTRDIIHDIHAQTGITATAGIGTNMYLAKVAMDIVAKHIQAGEDGIRIARLDEMSYRKLLWGHRPITDFWRVGRGYAKKLEAQGLLTMGDIARCSMGRADEYYNEGLLYKMFGVNAELLIDHAWGWEPCTIADIKAYKPAGHSMSSGQVLTGAVGFDSARLIVREMADTLSLDLVAKGVKAGHMGLMVGYDTASLDPKRLGECGTPELKAMAERAIAEYSGPVTLDRYGRRVPKPATGSIGLDDHTSSTTRICDAVDELFCRIVDHRLLVRRLNVVASDLQTVEQLAERNAAANYVQPDLFSDMQEVSNGSDSNDCSDNVDNNVRSSYADDMRVVDEISEQHVQQTILDIKRKFGKNAVIKGMDMFADATGQQRNRQIGGHAA
ncbi:MAG: type VI secretion protein ImpB [Bifidobacterium pseudocatenulatum]